MPHIKMKSRLLAVTLVLLTLRTVSAFDCRLDLTPPGKKASELHFDLTPLGRQVETSKTTETPPTTNEAKLSFLLCGDEGLRRDNDVAEEDQCPEGTKACLTLYNHKKSSSEASRVTAVIPIWPSDLTADDVDVKARENEEGVDITIYGPKYAGVPQSLKLRLGCSPMAKDDGPVFESYSDGILTASWSSPDACPKASDGSEDAPIQSGEKAKGGGIGSFFKGIFWFTFFGLLIYFVVGIYYNYSTYGSRGVDLLPHKDFWMDLPSMAGDLFSHLASNIRGSGTGGSTRRSGYTSLG